MNGSPKYPSMQIHDGMWFTTWHSALNPQDPGHGSTHFRFMQLCSEVHSSLFIHSDLQFGGDPMNPLLQEHKLLSPLLVVRHSELGPHGDGIHGLTAESDNFIAKNISVNWVIIFC